MQLKTIIFCLIVLYGCSGTLDTTLNREVKIKDLCISNVQNAVLIKEGVDFFLLDISIDGKIYRAYVGNHPKHLPQIISSDGNNYIFVKGTNVYKSFDIFFPAFLHIIDVKDLSVIKHINNIEFC